MFLASADDNAMQPAIRNISAMRQTVFIMTRYSMEIVDKRRNQTNKLIIQARTDNPKFVCLAATFPRLAENHWGLRFDL